MQVASRANRYVRRLPWRLYFERTHDLSDTVVVVGAGRSGTTWIAELLARSFSNRLIFEPFHPYRSPIGPDLRLFIAPEDPASDVARAMAEVLSGRVRARAIERPQPPLLPRGRIVKDIHAMNAVPWLAGRFPEVSLVYVLRHPLAVILSRWAWERRSGDRFYGLGRYLETERGMQDAQHSDLGGVLEKYETYRMLDPLSRGVAEWCLENASAPRCAAAGIPVLRYEDVVRAPRDTVARLVAQIGAERFDPGRLDHARRSSSDQPGGPPRTRPASESFSDDDLLRATKILADFGLESLYAMSEPLVSEMPR
jgi:hypothetical protein